MKVKSDIEEIFIDYIEDDDGGSEPLYKYDLKLQIEEDSVQYDYLVTVSEQCELLKVYGNGNYDNATIESICYKELKDYGYQLPVFGKKKRA